MLGNTRGLANVKALTHVNNLVWPNVKCMSKILVDTKLKLDHSNIKLMT
jgi:hypothetical protein